MSISTGIPSNWNVPLFWATVDGSQAGSLNAPQAALLIGQGSASQNAALNNVPTPVFSGALADQNYGAGSMLARMIKAFLKSNTTQQLWAISIPDPAGVAASGSIKIASQATAPGTLTVYIAGQRIQITVQSTDTPATVATNLNAAIAAVTDLPVTSTVDGVDNTKVDLTAKWKGTTSNGISIVPNFLGPPGGEAFPVGLTLTIVNMAGGTGVPTFTNAISAIQGQVFDYVALPYTDVATMPVWNTEYGFGPGGRWNYTRQQYGMIFTANTDTYANLITFGLGQNSPVMSTLAVEQQSPSPIWEWTAAYCACGALGFTDDPARPLQTLEMFGILPAPVQNRFTISQLNSLTNSGLAIQATAPDGNPMIMREQTQYQLNSFGQSDTAFGLLTVIATLAALLRNMKSSITSKYPRVKLVPDGTPLGPGQQAVTPTDIKAELVAEYQLSCFNGLTSSIPVFKSLLLVQINTQNPNRVDVLYPPVLAGQLRIFAALAQFRLLAPITVPGP